MDGMSGIELSIQLIQDRPSMKIMLISASDSEYLVRQRGWQFLRKPFVFETLRRGIQGLLGEL